MKDREKPAKVGVKESSTAALEREKETSEEMRLTEDDRRVLNTNYYLHDANICFVPAMLLLCLEAGMRQDSFLLNFKSIRVQQITTQAQVVGGKCTIDRTGSVRDVVAKSET